MSKYSDMDWTTDSEYSDGSFYVRGCLGGEVLVLILVVPHRWVYWRSFPAELPTEEIGSNRIYIDQGTSRDEAIAKAQADAVAVLEAWDPVQGLRDHQRSEREARASDILEKARELLEAAQELVEMAAKMAEAP